MTAGDESGFSLVELILAVLIMSVSATAVIAAMGTSFISGDVHRQNTTGEEVLRGYSESVKGKALEPTTTWPKCPQLGDFAGGTLEPSYVPPPSAGMAVAPTLVEYWIPDSTNPLTGTWQTSRSACTAYYDSQCGSVTTSSCDPGLIRLTLDVTSVRTDVGEVALSGRVLIRRNDTA
jgi:prepilin-type N-terminal cleavage/methylation domain-containing protein